MDSPGEGRRRFRGMRRAIERVASHPEAQGSGEPELRARLAHLERSLEALQDSVYRDKRRHEQELADLRKQLDPENLVRALSEDARRRGL